MMLASQPIVTSGDDEDVDSNFSDPEDVATAADALFDATADEHDASYVDRYLRSGASASTPKTDAVLSCPCCFQLVCMDCQRHDTFQHIYRAMFVMGITVSWDRPLHYDEVSQCLIAKEATVEACHGDGSARESGESTMIPRDEEHHDNPSTTVQEEVYYTVRCANCETVVAALDMRDEVYHFSGCLASA